MKNNNNIIVSIQRIPWIPTRKRLSKKCPHQ